MQKIVLATLAILGVMLGTAGLGAPSNASEPPRTPPSYGFGWG
jgi:hypothetical protein